MPMNRPMMSQTMHFDQSEAQPTPVVQPIPAPHKRTEKQSLPVAYSEIQLTQKQQPISALQPFLEAQPKSVDQQKLVEQPLPLLDPMSFEHSMVQQIPIAQHILSAQTIKDTPPMAVLQKISESQPNLDNRPLPAPQRISVEQPLPEPYSEIHPKQMQQPIPETEPKSVDQLNAVEQTMSVANMVFDQTLDNSESPPIPLKQPIPEVLYVPPQPTLVALTQPVMQKQPNQMSSVSQPLPGAYFENQKIQPIKVAQPISTDQLDSVSQSIPMSQRITQSEPLSETQTKLSKPTYRTQPFVTTFHWDRKFRRPNPFQRPIKPRKSYPTQFGGTNNVQPKPVAQRKFTRMLSSIFNVDKIKKTVNQPRSVLQKISESQPNLDNRPLPAAQKISVEQPLPEPYLEIHPKQMQQPISETEPKSVEQLNTVEQTMLVANMVLENQPIPVYKLTSLAQTMPLDNSEIPPKPLQQPIPEVIYVPPPQPTRVALTQPVMQNQPNQMNSVSQPSPGAYFENQKIQPIKVAQPISTDQLDSVSQSIPISQRITQAEPLSETQTKLSKPTYRTQPFVTTFHWDRKFRRPNPFQRPIKPRKSYPTQFGGTYNVQPKPVAQRKFTRMLSSIFNVDKIKKAVNQPMAVLQKISESQPNLDHRPLPAAQKISVEQSVQKHYSEIQPKQIQQPFKGTEPKPIDQLNPVEQTMSVANISNINQVTQKTSQAYPTPLAQTLPLKNSDSSPIPIIQSIPDVLHVPPQQPMPVALSEPVMQNQPNQMNSVSQPSPRAYFENQEIQPIKVAQPFSTDQLDSVSQSIPMSQTIMQVEPLSETQPKLSKPTYRTQPFVSTFHLNRKFRRPNPFRRPIKLRKPYPTQFGGTSNVQPKPVAQRKYIRLLRSILNVDKTKKRIAKACISIIGTILLILAVWKLWNLHTVPSTDLPPMTCPKYFQYLSEEGVFYGKMTLTNLPKEAIHVDLIMLQQQSLKNGYVGELTLYDNFDTTVKTLNNNESITYRVTFPQNTELPKVLSISVNGMQICASSKNLDPGSKIKLMHSFFPSEIPDSAHKKPSLAKVLPDIQHKFGVNVEAFKATTTQAPFLESRFAPPIPTAQCGRVHTGVLPLIYGGTELRRGQLPWLVAIYRKHYTGLQFICGGSLVSARTVITAAHCFKLYNLKPQQVVAFLGRHNLESYSEDGVVARETETLLIHPDYDLQKFPDADLALIQMQAPVSFNDYIQPICLWSGSEHDSLIVNQTGVVAGWGADESGRAVSSTPKMAETEIVGEAECLRSSEVFRKLTSKRTICAGRRDGTGPCLGDSGGGLMIKRDGRWMIRGIVSAGQTKYHTCNLHEFVIYCDLAKHMTWVQNNLLN